MVHHINLDLVAGLDQLLPTPNFRQRAGIEIADLYRDVFSPPELLMARKHGDLKSGKHDRQKNLRNSAGVQRLLS